MKSAAHCLQKSDIEKLLTGNVATLQSELWEEHISSCDSCRVAMASRVGDQQWWHDAERSLQQHVGESLRDSQILNQSRSVRLGETDLSDLADDHESTDELLKLLGPTDDPRMLGRIGSYEVLGVLGRGGMGIVFKAFDAPLNRYVAIKMLLPHLAASGAARKRFEREGQSAAAVIDDHVLPIYVVSQWQNIPYLVMQYSSGKKLQRRIDDDGPLDVKEILRIGIQAARGLAAAHAQGLVHRDVKPSNMLLDGSVERVMLTDFGLARAVDDASITRTGVIAGTPQYMSPEQARGGSVDARSDLFGLGCVLYAMCTGRPPFRADSSYAILRMITDDEPRSIREINPDIPEWLCLFISRLMAKSPVARFGNALEVADLLEQCLAHVQQPTSVPLPASLVSHATGRRSIFNSTQKGVLAMLGTIGMALLGMFLWQATESPDISGQWSSDEWGTVVLEAKGPGEYEGTFTGSGKDKPAPSNAPPGDGTGGVLRGLEFRSNVPAMGPAPLAFDFPSDGPHFGVSPKSGPDAFSDSVKTKSGAVDSKSFRSLSNPPGGAGAGSGLPGAPGASPVLPGGLGDGPNVSGVSPKPQPDVLSSSDKTKSGTLDLESPQKFQSIIGVMVDGELKHYDLGNTFPLPTVRVLDKTKSGTVHLKWSRVERRFNGTWGKGGDRNGKISLRLVDKEIRGGWTTDEGDQLESGTPLLGDLLWTRSVVIVPDGGTVLLGCLDTAKQQDGPAAKKDAERPVFAVGVEPATPLLLFKQMVELFGPRGMKVTAFEEGKTLKIAATNKEVVEDFAKLSELVAQELRKQAEPGSKPSAEISSAVSLEPATPLAKSLVELFGPRGAKVLEFEAGKRLKVEAPRDVFLDLEKMLKLVANDKSLDRQNARAVVEAYFAAAIAGRIDEATSLTEFALEDRPAARRHAEESSRWLNDQLNVQRLAIQSIYVDDPEKPVVALAITEATRFANQRLDSEREVFLVAIVMSKEGWLLRDCEPHSEQRAHHEMKKFLEANPKAAILPPVLNGSQVIQQERTSQQGAAKVPGIEKPLDRQNARAVVEACIAAVLAGNGEQVIYSLFDVQPFALGPVYVNNTAKPKTALATCKLRLKEPQSDGRREVCLVVTVTMSNAGWGLSDFELESEDGAATKLKGFLETNPNAAVLPPVPNGSQVIQQKRTSQRRKETVEDWPALLQGHWNVEQQYLKDGISKRDLYTAFVVGKRIEVQSVDGKNSMVFDFVIGNAGPPQQIDLKPVLSDVERQELLEGFDDDGEQPPQALINPILYGIIDSDSNTLRICNHAAPCFPRPIQFTDSSDRVIWNFTRRNDNDHNDVEKSSDTAEKSPIYVLHLKHAKAADVILTVRQLLPQLDSALTAVERTNSILVRCDVTQFKKLDELMKVLDCQASPDRNPDAAAVEWEKVDDSAKAVLIKLKGDWKLESMNLEGFEVSATHPDISATHPDMNASLSGRTLSMFGVSYEITAMDVSKNPMEISLTKDRQGQTGTLRSLLSFEDGVFILARPTRPGYPRPLSLHPARGSVIYRWTRMSEQAREGKEASATLGGTQKEGGDGSESTEFPLGDNAE